MDLIKRYFPDLDSTQIAQFNNLYHLYKFWNTKVNLISPHDLGHFWERHILHSLSIAKVCHFAHDSDVLDLGTGGGFPGIPLAILLPDVKFHLIDAIEKKTNAVFTISTDLGLQNVVVDHLAAQDLTGTYDFVVTRAVTNTEQIARWSKMLIKSKSINDLPNGVLLLKGGDLAELEGLDLVHYEFPITEFFDEPWFENKFLVYVAI